MDCAKSTEHSLDSVLDSLSTNKSTVLAGGTDYFPGLVDAVPDPRLLNVNRITGLDQIELINGQWRIGAAVTWTDVIKADLPMGFNCLKQAGREVGSIQIQNAASLVGNICNASPAADGVPALLALGAMVELASVDGVRVLPLNEFILGVRKTAMRENELVTALLIPDSDAQDHTEFTKLGSRTYLVISIVMCASRIRVDENNIITDAAIAVGACSPVACRLPAIEKAIIGRECVQSELTKCVLPKHLTSLSPISDVRATAEYRLHATQVLLQRQIKILVKIISANSSGSAT